MLNCLKEKTNLLIFGIYIFYLGYLLHYYVFQNTKWSRGVSVLGALFVVWGFLRVKKTLKGIDYFCLPLYYIFVAVCLINYFWGIPQMLQVGRLNEVITSPQAAWIYLIGFTFLIPIQIKDVRQLLKWSFVYLITSLVFIIYNYKDFFFDATNLIQSMIGWQAYIMNRPQEPVNMLVPIAAFFVLFKYFPKHWKVLVSITVPLSIIAASMAGRRTSASYLIVYLIIAYYFHLVQKKRRIANLIIGLLFCSAFFVELGGLKAFDQYFEKHFVILSNRIGDDTRSNVNEDFYNDMKEPIDWLIGRGMAGTYKSMSVQLIDRLHRQVHETGYLNIVLHGGLLMLAPYVLLLLFAFIKGFCFSKNYFVKSCALFVLFHLLLLYPAGQLRLSYECFILFVFLRICLSARWRNYKDNEIAFVTFPDESERRYSIEIVRKNNG